MGVPLRAQLGFSPVPREDRVAVHWKASSYADINGLMMYRQCSQEQYNLL